MRPNFIPWKTKMEARDWGKKLQSQILWNPDFSKHIFETPAFQLALRSSTRILAYVPFRNEAPLRALYERVWAEARHSLFFPRCEGSQLFFCRVRSWKDCSEDGPFPEARAGLERLYKSDEETLILVPGLLFHPSGYRIGYGKGFYDRWFQENPKGLRLAIAHGDQISHRSWPHETHDERVDWILSPSELWTPQREI